MNPRRDLSDLIRARYGVIYVVTHEEQRVLAEIRDVAKGRNLTSSSWTASRGFTIDGVEHDGRTDPIGALSEIAAGPTGPLQSARADVVVLQDFHVFLDDLTVRRWIRDLAADLRAGPVRAVVILAPTLKLPTDLEKDVAVFDWPLPSRDDIAKLYDDFTKDLKNGHAEAARTARDAIVEASAGLTMVEIENALAKGAVQLSRMDAGAVLQAKKDAVRKAGVLECQDAGASLDDVGGLDELKAWLGRRRKAFSPEARAFGIDVPKGVLVVGVPGSGKTLCARATAAAWGMPLLRMDVSRLLGSLVGESEGKLAQAIKVAEAVAPCVLLVDEIEKGLAGAGTDSSGVATRMLGTLLQWMAEKTAPVYVVATANDVASLPPELLRKGRFDEVWYADLPDAEARYAIFQTHLARRKHAFEAKELTTLATSSEGYVGAEIEAAIVEGLCTAFDEGRPLVAGDVARALQATIPLAVTMKEKIDALRAWAKSRARPASAPAKAAGTVVKAPPVRKLDLGDGEVN